MDKLLIDSCCIITDNTILKLLLVIFLQYYWLHINIANIVLATVLCPTASENLMFLAHWKSVKKSDFSCVYSHSLGKKLLSFRGLSLMELFGKSTIKKFAPGSGIATASGTSEQLLALRSSFWQAPQLPSKSPQLPIHILHS